jgi:very-short-patch-repair endonuclease
LKCEKNHEWETSLFYRAINNQNCPQCNNSKGEKAIAQLLDELNIEYIAQYPVKIGKSTRFFDFYIEDFNLFIEIHGLQHYENIEYFKSDVEKQQKIDKQKQQYAEKHGHYMMIDYREHSPELAVKRFEQQFDEFLDKILNDEVAI